MDSKDDLLFTSRGNEKYISPKQIFIEGDASFASYFQAGAAITGGQGDSAWDGRDSIQGDARFANVLEKMGADVEYGPISITVSRREGVRLKGIDEDCGDIPDVAMTRGCRNLRGGPNQDSKCVQLALKRPSAWQLWSTS